MVENGIDLEQIFDNMPQKDRVTLVSMIEPVHAKKLIDTLKPEEKMKFFFYQKFNFEVKLEKTGAELVQEICDKFQEKNN